MSCLASKVARRSSEITKEAGLKIQMRKMSLSNRNKGTEETPGAKGQDHWEDHPRGGIKKFGTCEAEAGGLLCSRTV